MPLVAWGTHIFTSAVLELIKVGMIGKHQGALPLPEHQPSRVGKHLGCKWLDSFPPGLQGIFPYLCVALMRSVHQDHQFGGC